MRISHRYKVIFFANPKTGSSTIRKFLDPYNEDPTMQGFRDHPSFPHMRPEEARRRFEQLGWNFGSYSRFVCVRNPWAKLVSLYHYIQRRRTLPPFEEWIASLADANHADIIEAKPSRAKANNDETEKITARWHIFGSEPLETFIKDADGNVLVDQVLRTEEIDDTLLPYLRGLGLPIAHDAILPRHNTTGVGRSYQEYYSPTTVDLVQDLYRYEIVHFGYHFGDPA